VRRGLDLIHPERLLAHRRRYSLWGSLGGFSGSSAEMVNFFSSQIGLLQFLGFNRQFNPALTATVSLPQWTGDQFVLKGRRGIRRKARPVSHDQIQEKIMKLNSMQIEQTLKQMEAKALPDDHPAVVEFSNLFGDHTFFLDAKGLSVLEAIERPKMEVDSGEVVSLASWSDVTLTHLARHAPKPTGKIISRKSTQH
jgi:hypothetical protein